MVLSKKEKGVLSVLKLNELFPIKGICKEVRVGCVKIKFEWRRKDNLWGRFGGGWNWIVGFELGGTSLILNLLVCSLRFSIRKKMGGEIR